MFQTSIKPAGHKLVIEPIELPEKTEGGIIIKHEGTMWAKLEAAGRMIGTVLAIGPQAWKAHAAGLVSLDEAGFGNDELLDDWCEVGDVVLYSRHAGKFIFDPMFKEQNQTEFGLSKPKLKELYVIQDDDVQAVLPPYEDWKVSILDLIG